LDFEDLTSKQKYLIETVRHLGIKNFAPRAHLYDAQASFPHENYQDLKEHGLLALCVPQEYGGIGADFATYCLVSTEIARYCGATALTYNMHICSTLWLVLTKELPMTEAQREECELYQAKHFSRIVSDKAIYSQPISEAGAGVSMGKSYQTSAKKVNGGWIINGTKIFASLSGAANYYGVVCTEQKDMASVEDTLYLAIPADARGVEVTGTWDPLGMRGTVSRTLIFNDVFVNDDAQLLPHNIYFKLTQYYPYIFFTLASTYMGIAQAVYDFTVKYLRGEVEGIPPIKRRKDKIKQFVVAEMFIKLEQTKALFHQVINETQFNPSKAKRLRIYAANYTIMENSNELSRLAIRVCGGQSLLKTLPLERLYRDSSCGAIMRPWSSDRCLDKLGFEALYEPGEIDD
jgi:alkylation response protein AidB-like acyl-CoA dehydrogenase